MKRLFRKYFPLIPAGLILGMLIFSPGCANTTQAPTGGPKDTIPPLLRYDKMKPKQGAVHIPRHKSQFEFPFNEYVVVKENKNIFLSPPTEKAPKFKIKGKSIVIYFENDLDSNRTYTLDITGAIGDNNEGNLFPGYTLVFSTGEKIDSMGITGQVLGSTDMMPVKGATVLLYRDQADSAVFLHRPDAAAKTDDWGYFAIRNIRDTLYRAYAIKDENNNNMYDPDNERIAFLDSLVRPERIVSDTLYEFLKFDMKDTAACLARKTDIELSLFREKPSKQFIVKKERVGERTAYITFMAPYAKINSMRVRGLPKEKLITQFNKMQDSLEIWVNDQRKRMPDTLFLMINYDKTDSLGNLVPTDEVVKLAFDKKLRGEMMRKASQPSSHEDTIAVFSAEVDPQTVEQYGFSIEFKYPLIESAFDSLVLRSVNPRQQEKIERYKVIPDSVNLRRFTVLPQDKLLPGFEYFLKVPYRKFRDINGFYNDSTEVKVSLPKDEKLSTMTLALSGVNNRYIIDLLTEKRDKIIRSFIVDNDGNVVLPYLKSGKYCIRFTEDVNRNGIVDTGSLLGHRQPEKVCFYKQNDSFLIEIPEMAEIEQEINLAELFQ